MASGWWLVVSGYGVGSARVDFRFGFAVRSNQNGLAELAAEGHELAGVHQPVTLAIINVAPTVGT